MGYKHIGALASDDSFLREHVENHIQSVSEKYQRRDHMLTYYVRTMKAIAIIREYDIMLMYIVQTMKATEITRE